MTLSQIYKQHIADNANQKQEVNIVKEKTQQSLQRLSDGVADTMAASATAIFNKERIVERSLQQTIAAQGEFEEERYKWVELSKKHREAHKLLGDVQTYTRSIVNDLSCISRAVEEIENRRKLNA